LPFIGWSILDGSGFLSNPVRLAYTAIVILLQIFIVMIEPGIGRQGNIGKRVVNRQQMAVILLQILSVAIVIFVPFSDRRNIGAFSKFEIGRTVGFGIFVMGFTIMNWAEIALGRLFSIQVTVQANHRLVTDGLFKYIRNPRYLGIILNNLGISLVFRSWSALILVFFLFAVLIWRIHDEEELLRMEFGESWEEYKKRTWRLRSFLCENGKTSGPIPPLTGKGYGENNSANISEFPGRISAGPSSATQQKRRPLGWFFI
jgi:protein-S-isoprenylcysteine O-methyltransferase Ste14